MLKQISGLTDRQLRWTIDDTYQNATIGEACFDEQRLEGISGVGVVDHFYRYVHRRVEE